MKTVTLYFEGEPCMNPGNVHVYKLDASDQSAWNQLFIVLGFKNTFEPSFDYKMSLSGLIYVQRYVRSGQDALISDPSVHKRITIFQFENVRNEEWFETEYFFSAYGLTNRSFIRNTKQIWLNQFDKLKKVANGNVSNIL